jgi:CRP/FNR family transcriptional regulator, cyclic AMP receptor protein
MIQRSFVGLLRGLRGERSTSQRTTLRSGLPSRPGESKLRHLSAIDIFQDLSAADLDWLAAHTTMVTARRGQLVYMPGETNEALFLLKAGRVRIYRLSADGKKLVLSELAPQTFFGDMPLAGQQMYGAFAEAIEDCTLCVLGRADLEGLIQTRPQVAIRLLEVIGRRLLEAEAIIEDFAFKSVAARLATTLLRLWAEEGDLVLGRTHQDLADMIGTYRETVTQTLDDFKRRGLIGLGRKSIRVLDRPGLEGIAEG